MRVRFSCLSRKAPEVGKREPSYHLDEAAAFPLPHDCG